jgi:hypothetical protein
MDNKKLSQMYFLSCDRIQQEATILYEALHDYAGNAIEKEDLVRHLCSNFTLKVKAELDGVKASCKELNETSI